MAVLFPSETETFWVDFCVSWRGETVLPFFAVSLSSGFDAFFSFFFGSTRGDFMATVGRALGILGVSTGLRPIAEDFGIGGLSFEFAGMEGLVREGLRVFFGVWVGGEDNVAASRSRALYAAMRRRSSSMSSAVSGIVKPANRTPVKEKKK